MATVTRESGNEPDAGQLRSVERALALLQVVAAQPAGVTPKEIGRDLNLHLSTVYRLLRTMVSAGYVERSATSGLFRLGPSIPQLHQAFLEALGPDTEAMPLLQALAATTGESVQVNMLRGDDAVVTAAVEGSRSGYVPVGFLGYAFPAHLVAAGRALLAHLPVAGREAYLTRWSADSPAPNAVRDPDALRMELDRIRADGYAVDRGRVVVCVAAPVVEAGGAVERAVVLMTPADRFEGEASKAAAVVAVARALSAISGPRPADERASGLDRPQPDATAAAALAELLKAPATSWPELTETLRAGLT